MMVGLQHRWIFHEPHQYQRCGQSNYTVGLHGDAPAHTQTHALLSRCATMHMHTHTIQLWCLVCARIQTVPKIYYSIIPGSRSSGHLPKSKEKNGNPANFRRRRRRTTSYRRRGRHDVRVREREKNLTHNTNARPHLSRVYLCVWQRKRKQEIERLAWSEPLKYRYLFWHDTYFMYFRCLIFVFFALYVPGFSSLFRLIMMAMTIMILTRKEMAYNITLSSFS